MAISWQLRGLRDGYGVYVVVTGSMSRGFFFLAKIALSIALTACTGYRFPSRCDRALSKVLKFALKSCVGI